MRLFHYKGLAPETGSWVLRLLRNLLPRTSRGDALFSLAKFLKRNRRWPARKGGDLNDFLYHLRVSRDIDHPLRNRVTCKLRVRDHFREKLGKDLSVPLLAVLGTKREVLDHPYPPVCVVKPSHLSGEVVLRKGGEPLDLERIASWLDRDFYFQSRERNYRGLERRILVEPYLSLDGDLDYKVHCLRGDPKIVSIHLDHEGFDHKYRYSPDWRLLDRLPNPRGKEAPLSLPRPDFLEEILDLARTLSRDFLAIRVDFLVSGGRVYLGELTSVPGGAGLRYRDPVTWRAYNQAQFGEKGFDLEDFPELKA